MTRSSSSDVSPMPYGKAFLLVIVGAIFLGIFFRFYHLDRKTFWEDEIVGPVRMLGYTEADIVEASPRLRDAGDLQRFFHVAEPARGFGGDARATVRALAMEDPQHTPVYYVLSHWWVERMGTSIAALRTPAACFSVLALFAMFWLARELFASSSTAWIAVALLALSPLNVLYGQEAREYSLWTVALLASSAVLLWAVRSDSRIAWICYAMSIAISLYIFPLSALVIFGQGVYLILSGASRTRTVATSFFVSCSFAALLLLPWLLDMNAINGLRGLHTVFSARTSVLTVILTFLRDVKDSIIDFGFVRRGLWHSINTAAGFGVTALIAFAMYVLVHSRQRKAAIFLLVGFSFSALPLVVRDLVVRGGLVFQTRYFMPASLDAILAMAYLFDSQMRGERQSVGRRRAWTSGFALVLGIELASCAVSSQARTWWNKDYERTPSVAALIDRTPHPLVMSDLTTSRVLGLGFYLDPQVSLDVNLHCDSCSVAPTAPGRAVRAIDEGVHFSDVFLLERRNTLPVGAFIVDAEARGARLHRIEIQIYPRTAAPLNMFRAVY